MPALARLLVCSSSVLAASRCRLGSGGIEIAELQLVWEGEVGLLDTRQCCRRRERDIYCCSVEKKNIRKKNQTAFCPVSDLCFDH